MSPLSTVLPEKVLRRLKHIIVTVICLTPQKHQEKLTREPSNILSLKYQEKTKSLHSFLSTIIKKENVISKTLVIKDQSNILNQINVLIGAKN